MSCSQAAVIHSRQESLNHSSVDIQQSPQRSANLLFSLSSPLDPKTEPKAWTLQADPHTSGNVPLYGLIATTFQVVSAAWRSAPGEQVPARIVEWCNLSACSKITTKRSVDVSALAWLTLNSVQNYFASNLDSRAEFEGRFHVWDYAYINKLYGPRFEKTVAIFDVRANGQRSVAELDDSQILNSTTQSPPPTNDPDGLQASNKLPDYSITLRRLPNPVTGIRTRAGLFLMAMRHLCWNKNALAYLALADMQKGTAFVSDPFNNAGMTIDVVNDRTSAGSISLDTLEGALRLLWTKIPDQYRGGFEADISIIDAQKVATPFLEVAVRYLKPVNEVDTSVNTPETIPGLTSGETNVINGTLPEDAQDIVLVSR